jgi:hypothetical protein
LAAFDPKGVVTTTLAVPAVPAGVVQLAEKAERTLKDAHETSPTLISVAPIKPEPLI